MKKCGFTLAETLITLVIVGVVAALTVPNMIIKHQKEETATRLKKVYSMLSQAYVKSQTDHGTNFNFDIDYSDFDAREQAFQEYFLKYLKVSKYCPRTNLSDCFPEKTFSLNGNAGFDMSRDIDHYYTYSLDDGICIVSWLSDSHIQFYADLNCKKKPNKLGRDIFQMTLYTSTKTEYAIQNGFTKTGLFFPRYINGNEMDQNMPRETILSEDYALNCNKKKGGNNCGALIQMDGWQIKDDYPW